MASARSASTAVHHVRSIFGKKPKCYARPTHYELQSGFQTLFSDDIVVTGGDGFTIMIANNAASTTNGNVIRSNALIIDATIIPEPSAALLGGLGFFALLRRRR